ncbi:hypothetical protein [Nocardia jiangsuensis]|uniref:Excreted virulence factor EspC (Type VII ESX diderm) n=1 Tax=Nocardia jiangsuensis TaxID=1691563 RepID=A0ABV8DV28_9NOCA
MADTSDSVQSFTGLATDADNSRLMIQPGTAERCAAECDTYVLQLRALYRRAESVVHVDSFGALPSAQKLGGKFRDLAIGGAGTGSYREAIQKHIETVEAMADMFRKAGAAYAATEQGNTADIGRST